MKHGPSQRLKDMAPGQGWGSRGKGSGASFWDAREDGICQEGSLWGEVVQAIADAEPRSKRL